eukprot:194347-Prymnesium_polylepis.1
MPRSARRNAARRAVARAAAVPGTGRHFPRVFDTFVRSPFTLGTHNTSRVLHGGPEPDPPLRAGAVTRPTSSRIAQANLGAPAPLDPCIVWLGPLGPTPSAPDSLPLLRLYDPTRRPNPNA